MTILGEGDGSGYQFERITCLSLGGRTIVFQAILLCDQTSIAMAYNRNLDSVAGVESFEAVAPIYDEIELVDTGWQAKFADALHGGETAVVISASGSGGMARSTRDEQRGAVREPSHSYGFDDRLAQAVEIGGLCIVLAPLAIANLRFDDNSYPPLKGYDTDIYSTALAAGRRMGFTSIDLVQHTKGAFGSTKPYSDWTTASLAWRVAWVTMTAPRCWLLKARKAVLTLEVRLRPSTRARWHYLIFLQAAPAQMTTAGGGS